MDYDEIDLTSQLSFSELQEKLSSIEFRGLYGQNGQCYKPYHDVKFSLATLYPASSMHSEPILQIGSSEHVVYSPQPTIYQNQSEVIASVDAFLATRNMKVNRLDGAINYHWRDRGDYTILPPIIEHHTLNLNGGFIDLNFLNSCLSDKYVKDAKGVLHNLGQRYLQNFYIDEVSSIPTLDIFHSNIPLINYGLRYTGPWDYYIICDGSHRIDYAIEQLKEPITVVVVEKKYGQLIPYYALPMPFRPTLRLTSKRAEAMYPRLERDKFHLLNDFLKKTLHYDWTKSGLNVSSLRSKTDIY